MLFTYVKKSVLGLVFATAASLGFACGGGHWGGGYVHGHPGAFHQHGEFYNGGYQSRLWYGSRYHPGEMRCQVVRQCYYHHHTRFCEPVRYCQRVW